MSDRDRMLLEKIIAYCQDIASLKNEFGGPEQFRTHLAYRNACAMCVLQIGELSANLTDDAKRQMRMIPWHMVKGLRNILAHDYGNVNWDSLWETISEDIPILEMICKRYLESR